MRDLVGSLVRLLKESKDLKKLIKKADEIKKVAATVDKGSLQFYTINANQGLTFNYSSLYKLLKINILNDYNHII